MRALIIGNSATAVGAVETIRQYDQSCEILIISEEPHGIYSRPLLSHYLGGEIDAGRLSYRQTDFYTKHNVQAILDTHVEAIEPDAHQVRTASGDVYHYDRLLIATGGIPIVPPTPGVETNGVYSFTRLDDVQGIVDYMAEHPVEHAVVVGGGMIGIKATDALMKRNVGVTMVELAPRILSAAMDDAGSAMVTRLFEKGGVEVLTGNTITNIQSTDGHISAVELRDGRVVACQLLIFGIGVRPNSDLARAAGIDVNRGVVVDEYMRTSAPDVYAAGDVAEAYDLVVDMNRTVAIWPNAYRQGGIAGAHMVGVPRSDQGGVAMNTIEVCGVPAMSIGNGNASEEDHEIMVEIDERNSTYKRLVIKDECLVGAILIGNINRAGIYTGLIRNRMNVEHLRKSLLGEHFGLLSLPDTYRKHIVTGSGIEV